MWYVFRAEITIKGYIKYLSTKCYFLKISKLVIFYAFIDILRISKPTIFYYFIDSLSISKPTIFYAFIDILKISKPTIFKLLSVF